MHFRGTYTALVTPFREDTSIDWNGLDRLIDDQLMNHIDGLVVCGTTGESPTLTEEEKTALLTHVVQRAKGRTQIIAGTGSSCTKGTIKRSKEAEQMGVDALMLVVPYYSKPTQEGLIVHFVRVAQAVSCPILLYNIPKRTGIHLSMDTLMRICEQAPNIIGIKESTGNVLVAQEIVCRLGDRLTVLSGDDALTLPMMAVGGRGVVSVTANLLPADVRNVTQLALQEEFTKARQAHLSLVPVHQSMFLEANPAPVKASLAAQGKMLDVLRSPLVSVREETRRSMLETLKRYQERKAP